MRLSRSRALFLPPPVLPSSPRCRGAGATAAARHAEVDAWRMVGHLRQAGRRIRRTMRADAERDCRRPPGSRPSVVILKTADRKSRILRILAPLGVLLKDGMELYIDNNNIGRAYFTRCFSEGCYVEVDIDDELLKVLRAGKNAVFALRESVDQTGWAFRSNFPALPRATTRFPEASS